MDLTDAEKAEIKGLIDAGRLLPAKYRLRLFEDAPETELIWKGKSADVTSAVLPFQSIEQIDEPRARAGEYQSLFPVSDRTGRQAGGWANKLIWGDNKLVLSSLINGPLRRQIDAAGGLKLIYIDPPFDVGADFSVDIEVGDGETLTKEPSVIEELAYRDTWGGGTDSYLCMIYERLRLMRDLLADDGLICVHCDWRVAAPMRALLGEIFGSNNFINEIIWVHQIMGGAHGSRLPKAHETILWAAKSDKFRLNVESIHIRVPFSKYVQETMEKDADGKWFYTRRRMSRKATDTERALKAHTVTYVEDPSRGTLSSDVWVDMPSYQPKPVVNTKYPTQKPDELLERIIGGTTHQGQLVADFFCGSGTTLAVAERLGRKWIGCDLGRFAIHTSRKRLIGVQRELGQEGKSYRSFEILNLGKYERQYFVGIDPNLPETERRAQSIRREEHYLNLILSAYKAERVFQAPPFHGKKGRSMVVVGPVDAPVTHAQFQEVVAAARNQKFGAVDLLGFEFEMGLAPNLPDEARRQGVNVALKCIPKHVFDKRAVDAGQVQFYDLAYIEVRPQIQGLTARVTLADFSVYYRQEDVDALGVKLKPGGSKVTVANGQVVKLVKDKKGIITSDVLTKKWTDWVDYWAVDFHYGSTAEVITEVIDGREVTWTTGNFIFENEWQSFRTRKDRSLELTSAAHEYPKKGKYKVAVKVIDIFGNDTTKVVGVTI